jgi:hypothetical protein
MTARIRDFQSSYQRLAGSPASLFAFFLVFFAPREPVFRENRQIMCREKNMF